MGCDGHLCECERGGQETVAHTRSPRSCAKEQEGQQRRGQRAAGGGQRAAGSEQRAAGSGGDADVRMNRGCFKTGGPNLRDEPL